MTKPSFSPARALRSFGTPLTIAASIAVLGTGLFMYLAYKTKTLEETHAQIGLAMTAAVAAHVALNWRPFVAHLSRPRSYWALIAVAAIAVNAAYFRKEPAALSAGALFKRVEKSDVETVAKLFGVSFETAARALAQDGVAMDDPRATFESVAVRAGRSPRELLRKLSEAADAKPK